MVSKSLPNHHYIPSDLIIIRIFSNHIFRVVIINVGAIFMVKLTLFITTSASIYTSAPISLPTGSLKSRFASLTT